MMMSVSGDEELRGTCSHHQCPQKSDCMSVYRTTRSPQFSFFLVHIDCFCCKHHDVLVVGHENSVTDDIIST
ncbi:hypothetical protein INR49_019335, partial [Caranx melampygus]